MQVSIVICMKSLMETYSMLCRTNPSMNDLRKAFHVGGNSSLRSHIRQHYEIYLERCKEAKIEPHHHAMPRNLWKKKKETETKGSQTKIDGIFKLKKRAEFDRVEILDSTAKFIACGDQVRDLQICSIICQHPAVPQASQRGHIPQYTGRNETGNN
jgi:hypothetical protein